MKSVCKTLGIVIGVFLAVCMIALAILVHSGYGISEGRFFRADNGSALLLDEYGATVLSEQRVGMFEKLENGDKILVIHDGIAESYPAQTGAYGCVRLEKGCHDDLPENVLNSLCDLGWISQTTEPEPTPDIAIAIPFSAQYIRTNGESIDIPKVSVLTTTEQLQAYYEENKDRFDLERNENTSSDYAMGFLDACDKYDDAFFRDNQLIIVTLEEGSGSVRHEVVRIETNAVYIQSVVPEFGTCDMAQWHILMAIPASHKMMPAKDISVIYDGKDITEEFTVAECSSKYGNISLNIPEGWEYEISTSSAEGMSCGIYFWPAGEEKGKISVTFIPDGWGVCGTGLREEKTVIGNYPVSIGYYDGKSTWDYIYFYDLPGAYVVQRWDEIPWWSSYKDKVMEILSSVRLAEGFITKSAAISEAITKLGGGQYKSCEDIWTVYDMKNGIWQIEFYRYSKDHATVTVKVDFQGNVIEIVE